MKKVTLLASLLALALGASAQNQPSAVRVPPNARGGERPNAISGVTTVHPDAAAEPANTADKPARHEDRRVPPVAKVPPSAVHVSPTAKK